MKTQNKLSAVPNQNDDLPPIPPLEKATPAQDFSEDQFLKKKIELEAEFRDAKDAFKRTLFGRFLNLIGRLMLLGDISDFIAEYFNEGANDAKRNLENHNQATRTNELETTKQNLNQSLGKDENGNKLAESEEVAQKNKKAEVLFGDDAEKVLVQQVNTKLAEQKLEDAVGKKVDIESAITAANRLLYEAVNEKGIFYPIYVMKEGSEINNIRSEIKRLRSQLAEANKEIGKCTREYKKELSKIPKSEAKAFHGKALENLKSELNTKQSAIAQEKIGEATEHLKVAQQVRERYSNIKESLHKEWKTALAAEREAVGKAAVLKAQKKGWFDSPELTAAKEKVQTTLAASRDFDIELRQAIHTYKGLDAQFSKFEKILNGLQNKASEVEASVPAQVQAASAVAQAQTPVPAPAQVPAPEAAPTPVSVPLTPVPAPFAAPTPVPTPEAQALASAAKMAVSDPVVSGGLQSANNVGGGAVAKGAGVTSEAQGQGQGGGRVN